MDTSELADREEIRQTIAQYNMCGDMDDAEGYADCFAQDALFRAPGFHHNGRETIRQWKASHRIFKDASFRMHVTTGTWIKFISTHRARVVSNWLAITNSGPDHAGRYHDIFVRTAEGWKIAERCVDILWRDDASRVGSEHLGRASDRQI